MRLDDLRTAETLSTSHTGVIDATLRRVRVLIDTNAPLRESLSQLTATVEHLSGGHTVASILLLDDQGLLRNGASPSLPSDYLKAIDGIKPDPLVGTCAAAAARGELVFTPSFQEDAKWAELRHLPLAIGFAGAWSMPIKSDAGEVLGTFGSYFRESRLPSPAEVAAVRILVPAAAQAIAAAR